MGHRCSAVLIPDQYRVVEEIEWAVRSVALEQLTKPKRIR
jgi:hypothetical protein